METKIDILFQDQSYLVLHKPAGMLVHPQKENRSEKTLMHFAKELSGAYVYPLHRLDRQVSGAVIFGLDEKVTKELKDIWNTDQVKKTYLALAKAPKENEGVFDFPLTHPFKKWQKQKAITEYKVIERINGFALFEIKIKTGRRHQIRRHFSRRMMNLVGDRKYGKKIINDWFENELGLSQIFLHHYRFQTPELEIECPLPKLLDETLKKLRTGDLAFNFQLIDPDAEIRSLIVSMTNGDELVCPSEVARKYRQLDWRDEMSRVRDVAAKLQKAGKIRVFAGENEVFPPYSGPIKLKQA